MQCVFDNPVHPDGGCIFADPSVFLQPATDLPVYTGGGLDYRLPGLDIDQQILRGDIEIVALVVAAIEAGIIE